MTGYNILGQRVNIDNPGRLAIGMYFYENASDAPVDCGALQPVMVVAHHGVDASGNATGVQYACNGQTTQVHEPDIYIVDDAWKGYIKYVMIIACIVLAVAITRKLI